MDEKYLALSIVDEKIKKPASRWNFVRYLGLERMHLFGRVLSSVTRSLVFGLRADAYPFVGEWYEMINTENDFCEIKGGRL